jgi:pyruvate,water dikinase
MFIATPIPSALRDVLAPVIVDAFEENPVVVRSSAPAEDTATSSFAGLHESYVNVHGLDDILKHIRLVWASLWSDGALLYRHELGLDIETSAMAVVIQRIIIGDRSGVAFCRNPADQSQAVIEAVYGLNEGFVDGTVEPDRWVIDRATGNITRHTPATRSSAVRPAPDGTILEPLPDELKNVPPLDDAEVSAVHRLAGQAEQLFGYPQDVEWTFADIDLYCLQSRAITTLQPDDGDDEREWYLSLRPGFKHLQALREKIETQIIPGMMADAQRLGEIDPARLADSALADHIRESEATYNHWVDVYWADLIPFAHGVRLFGRFYNDSIEPEDPYEFVDLLAGGRLESTERNRILLDLAGRLRDDEKLAACIRESDFDAVPDFTAVLDDYLERFGDVTKDTIDRDRGRELIARLALEMAGREQATAPEERAEVLRRQFLDSFCGTDRDEAEQVLELAQASYRMRDDDNIYLAKVEAPLTAAMAEATARLSQRIGPIHESTEPDELGRALDEPGYMPKPPADEAPQQAGDPGHVTPRQLVGQPAGPGLGNGIARVITDGSQLFEFREGEVLVCDAVEPDMTLIVPLAAGIVERRGGMLVHGAIIAREYGLPCVTGVPRVTDLIATGDRITVDGHLGIVIIDRPVS